MKLNDMAVRKAKPEAKPYKMADGGGMYLEVMPSGSKYWRFKYRFGGKEKRLAFGVYPDVTLSLARSRRDDVSKLLANEVDLGVVKQQSKRATKENAANSFEAIAREWFAKFSPQWALSHADKIIRRLENDAFPWIGSKSISESVFLPSEITYTDSLVYLGPMGISLMSSDNFRTYTAAFDATVLELKNEEGIPQPWHSLDG